MSYSRVVRFHSSAEPAPDAADLRAHLLDAAGDEVVVDVGDFVDLGDGYYIVLVEDIPNLHQGAVRIYDNNDAPTTLDVQAINATDDPCCAENSPCVLGTGSLSVDYCLKSPVTGAPLEGVTVEVYTDAERVDRVAVGVTDEDGNVSFMLDPGTYYLFRYKVGVTFTDPHVRTVA